MTFYHFKSDLLIWALFDAYEALNFYGGVPKILKPDNTKAASIKNTKDVLILNKVYEDLQDYYNTVIVPAPPLKPRAYIQKKIISNYLKISL